MQGEAWYVVKQATGACEIVPASEYMPPDVADSDLETHWGPYPTQGDAIARRVGLIRAGKCKPV